MNSKDIKKGFGYLPEDFFNGAHSIYKMAWEQVLLLSLYTRQQLIKQEESYCYPVDSNVNFENKLKLISLLFNPDLNLNEDEDNVYKILRDEILDMVENYNDIHHITNHLSCLVKQKSENENLSEIALSLLKRISGKHISFTSRDGTGKHYYSYYSMYKSLTDSLFIFRSLLELDFSEDYMNNLFLRKIRYKFCNRNNIHTNTKDKYFYFKESLNNAKSVNDAFYIILNEPSLACSIKDIAKDISASVSNEIGEKIAAIINGFHREMPTKGGFSPKYLSLFEQMVSFDKELDGKQNRVLRINEKVLRACISLGQVDEIVVEAIKSKLLDKGTPRQSIESPIGDRDSLLKVADWYNNVKTELCPTITDCPSLVASILEFDCRNRIGVFDEKNGVLGIHFHKSTWFNKDGYLLVTGLIRKYLFKNLINIDTQDPKNDSQEKISNEFYIKSYLGGNLEKVINSEKEKEYSLPNDLMKDWANLVFDDSLSEDASSYKAMMNRFKRLPIYLKPVEKVKNENSDAESLKPHKRRKQGIWHIHSLITKQEEESKKGRYPIDSSFPLPLWIKIDFKQGSPQET